MAKGLALVAACAVGLAIGVGPGIGTGFVTALSRAGYLPRPPAQ